MSLVYVAEELVQEVPLATSIQAPLYQIENLIYQGSFRAPVNAGYSGLGMGYSVAHNSLYMGRLDGSDICEMSIPAAQVQANPLNLPRATFLQNWTDATEGKLLGVNGIAGAPTNSVRIGGVLPYGGRLIISAYRYYDAGGLSDALSHIVSGLDLSVVGDATGPWVVGTNVGSGHISGCFAPVPTVWQALLGGPVLNGLAGIPIVTRASLGPTAYAIDPDQIGVTVPAPAVPLAVYNIPNGLYDYNANYGHINLLFNATSEVRGIVACPSGTRTVAFFGMQGTGPACYGIGGATVGPGVDCPDSGNTSHGEHAAPYKSWVWLYDANDLAYVKAGQRQPYEIRPYAYGELPLPYSYGSGPVLIAGAVFKESTGEIIVSQARGSVDDTIFHVFKIGTPIVPPPTPTFNLTVGSGTGSGPYQTGQVVNIGGNAAPAGQVFVAWTGGVSGVADIHAINTTITIGSADVTVVATYAAAYSVDVTHGTGSAIGAAGLAAGAVRAIVADAPPSGKTFSVWKGDIATVANIHAASTTITVVAQSARIPVDWDDEPFGTEIDGFLVDFGTSPGVYPNSRDAGLTSNIVLTGLVDGVTYYMAIRAYNSWGVSARTAEFSGVAYHMSVTATYA